MILNFADKRTSSIWEGYRVPGLPIEIQEVARRKLRMINNAYTIHDLSIPPSNRLEKLKGNLSGTIPFESTDNGGSRSCGQVWMPKM
jgi:proteic killer suppression protein